MKVFLICTVFIYSCSIRENSLFTKADKVEIVFYNDGDTLKTHGMTRKLMLDIDRLLDGKAEPTPCIPTGRVVFYIDSSVVYGLEFSTEATGAADQCQYMMLENKGWQLPYNIGMFLDETFNDTKRKNE